MKRVLLAAALPAVLGLGLVACGDDDNSPTTANTTASATQPTTVRTSETNGTEEGSDITLPGGVTIPDLGSILPGGSLPNLSLPDISIPELGSLPTNAESILKSVFPKLDDQQLQCLVDNLGGSADMSRITSLLDKCNIDMNDLVPG
jgi:hypothetical protein